jgi:ligand-binding sensor domain-containing protein/signal transduction histidine kinase
LPQSNVRATLQVPGRRLLVATSGGLALFDGLRFTPVSVDAADPLANEPVNALLVTRNGDLWIGTDDRGVIRQHGQTAVAISEQAGLHQERIRALAEDQSGTIWVATQNGIERIVGDKVESLPSLGLVSGNFTTPFAEDSHGHMFIVTSKGLFLWTGSQAQPFPIHHRELGEAEAVYSDGNGTVWLGMFGGLLKLTPKPGDTYTEELQPGVHGLVASLLQDRDGYLWVGTRGNGICRVSPEGSVTHWKITDGLSDDNIRSLGWDDEGDLWIGTQSGGLTRWRKSALIPFGQPEGFPSGLAANVLGDRRGELWLGTWGSGLLRLKQGKLQKEHLEGAAPTAQIRALEEDKQGNVWIGTWFNGLYRYDGRQFEQFLLGTESPANAVSALLSDQHGGLWVGTYKGLLRFPSGVPQPNQGELLLPGSLVTAVKEDDDGSIVVGTFNGLYVLKDKIAEPITTQNGLSNTFVLSVSKDSLGGIWVGTKAGGVDFVAKNRAVHIPAESGIPAYPVYSVLDDRRGMLWLSTTRGLLRVPLQQMHELADGTRKTVDAVLLGRSDGMRSSECGGPSQPPAARTSDGALWFATENGFVHTGPSESPDLAPRPEIAIEGVSLDNVFQQASNHLTLAPGLADLEFQFDAVRLANPSRLQFRYKLQGYDRDWTIPRGRRAHYKRLPPGKYVFLVSARDAGTPWNDAIASVEVEQKPFFYQTTWFYLLAAGVLGSLVAVFFRLRVARIKGQLGLIMDERNRIAREWHDTLMAGFAAISWQLEVTKDRFVGASSEAASSLDLARNMVRHCQAEARRIIWDLRDGPEPVGPLSEILTRELSAMRGALGVDTRLSVTGQEVSLSPLTVHHLFCICQEAVTNAIRHAAPTSIRINVEYQTAGVALSVKDDGRGFQFTESPTNGHFGIPVMEERARKLGGHLRVQSTPGAGTEILVDVPLGMEAGEP